MSISNFSRNNFFPHIYILLHCCKNNTYLDNENRYEKFAGLIMPPKFGKYDR